MTEFDAKADNESFFEESIRPLFEKLIEICTDRGIPLILAAQFAPQYIARVFILPDGCDSRLLAMGAACSPDMFVQVVVDEDAGTSN